ncbi:conserved hypothetical protein [Leishmania mexicana MHOM/GT/2001/U1103]|uniref:Uncharacterized protein n=1 Tax=Leishmania mexicana (strain MHOM/GT/2001/U1103) TaxID=929439 RepID=E9B135_LEIMU|nr:conserved hypothetical protein [Leishmania mexicana MHOM/GT/2001/U1103]CBZ28941.1 conserved hypothetical protein [Leishmania mexicana MHOM/GT/2001/U1103]
MDVDTLLTRQMELHTSLRQPPKRPQDLVQLMDMMRNYKHFFGSLRTLAERSSVEPETVFQAFMHISVGGTVNFDRQHQDGAVPMHQAKVLPRTKAIELAPRLCKELPNPELMVYVGLSRDLRNTLRVKVEDGNDLKTAEKSVCEAVEYLNFINSRAHHNTEKLYALYMAEDPNSLSSLLGDGESSMAASGATFQDTFSSTTLSMQLPTLGNDGAPLENEQTALPSPLSSFIPELKKQCAAASDVSSVSGGATKRLKASQVLLDWIATVPAEYFAQHAEGIVGAVSSTLALLAAEKRSALCRLGCDIIIMLMQRLSPEPVFIEDVHRGTCSASPATFSGALSNWVSSLAKGIYVTIAAISSATDAALRAIAIQSHGHLNVVRTLLTALSGGAQTELRRKCLGYLALCVVAAHQKFPERVRELVHLLGPVAVKYVANGDSPSRKMARALCSVLRVLAPATSPRGSDRLLHIADERIEVLVQQERPQVEPAVLGGPQELENLLFEADTFVSSIRSTFSAGSQRSLLCGIRGRGRQGSFGADRSALQRDAATTDRGVRGRQNKLGATDAGATAGSKPSTKHSEGITAAALAELRVTARSPTCQHTTACAVPHGRATAEVQVPTRSAVGRRSLSPSGGLSPTSNVVAGQARTRKVSSHRAKMRLGSVYDAEAFLGSHNATPTSAAKRSAAEESPHRCVVSRNTLATHAPPLESGTGGHESGAGHVTAVTAGSNGGHQPILPTLTSARRRTPHADRIAAVEEGVLPPPRGAAVLSSDRLVPLSLRNHVGHDGEAACRGLVSPSCSSGSAAAGPNVPRISQSLRRKIEENKGSLGL